jgi:hypothetical protein
VNLVPRGFGNVAAIKEEKTVINFDKTFDWKLCTVESVCLFAVLYIAINNFCLVVVGVYCLTRLGENSPIL